MDVHVKMSTRLLQERRLKMPVISRHIRHALVCREREVWHTGWKRRSRRERGTNGTTSVLYQPNRMILLYMENITFTRI